MLKILMTRLPVSHAAVAAINMRKSFLKAMAIVVAAATLTTMGCASREAPSAEKVQQQIAAARVEEINLVRATIVDVERADRFVTLLEERDRIIDDYVGIVAAYREKILAMSAEYTTTRPQITGLVSGYNQDRANVQRKFADLFDAMKRETTADEWKKIARYQVKRLNPRQLSYTSTTGES